MCSCRRKPYTNIHTSTERERERARARETENNPTVKTLRPTVDLGFIFLAEKKRIMKNKKVVSCTSFLPGRFYEEVSL